ncbi:MAG: hypothetical protein ACTSXJ_07855 [Candidatus Baldrarchaeia archaeon]
MEIATKIAISLDLLVADSTGIPHRRKGLHFKVHFLYDIQSDLVITATATDAFTADYRGYQRLLQSVSEGIVVLASPRT